MTTILGRSCAPTEPCRVQYAAIESNVSTPFEIRFNRTHVVGRGFLYANIAALPYDLRGFSLSLHPGDVLEVETAVPAEVDCTWTVEELSPDIGARLYPLEQPAVQAAVEEMFKNWNTIGSLSPEIDAAEAAAGFAMTDIVDRFIATRTPQAAGVGTTPADPWRLSPGQHSDSRVKYEQVVKLHPNARVSFKQIAPFEENTIASLPVAYLKTYDDVINHIAETHWRYGEASYKWVVYDVTKPLIATGVIRFSEQEAGKKKQQEKPTRKIRLK